MNDTKPAKEKDSFDYCIEFWEGAIDPEVEIDLCLRELPRHVRAANDVA